MMYQIVSKTTVVVAILSISMLISLSARSLGEDHADDSVLVRQLSGRNASIRSRVLSKLESDRDLAIDSLQQLVIAAERISEAGLNTEFVDPFVLRLIELIGSIDDDLSEQGLIDLLDSPNTGIAMIAADTLGKRKFYGSIDFLKQQVGHPEYKDSYAFRFNLIRSLVQMEHPDAIEFVTVQAKSLDGQLRHKIDTILDGVTIDEFRGDQQRFEAWSASRKDKPASNPTRNSKTGSPFKNASPEPESLRRIRLAKQQYYGIEIHAKRLMFIIDHSGSMKEYDRGQTRLDRAKVELNRAIELLPEDTEFALVFYDAKVASWKDELVPATAQNKQDASDLIRGLRPGETTNTYGALRRSIDFDDTLEAVFLLTDGRPTTGEIVRPEAIVEDILYRNRYRHLNFNTIGIAVSGLTESFLKTLADQSGGEFRSAK
jgi:hypothetical protein